MADFLFKQFVKSKLFIKYSLIGFLATILEVVILFCLSDCFKFWYIISCSIAYLISFAFSFVFRKIWVFKDADFKKIYEQIFWYLVFLLSSLAINAFLVFVIVEKYKVYYIIAQLISGFFIGFLGFAFNRTVTFKRFPQINESIYDKIKEDHK